MRHESFDGGPDRVREFEAVAMVHLDALYRTALRLTGNRAEADDVVQETFLRAFKSFDRFIPATNCRAWLFTIMRNAFLNRLRDAAREVPDGDLARFDTDQAVPTPAGAPSPEETFFQTVVHGDVDRALKALPLVFREAVVLADLEGLSYVEMSVVLGCPIGTVMSRLARGRRLLRTMLFRFAHDHGYVKGADAP